MPFMRHFLIIVFLAITFHDSSAQSLAKYADRLYFGMLSLNPDTSIKDFLKAYVPIVLQKPDTNGKWTMYSTELTTEPKHETVINSYVFDKHPYFDGPFQSGQLALTQKIYNDGKWQGNQLTDIRLWFECDNEKDARKSFKQLVDMFSSFHTLKRLSSQQGMEKAEFTDKKSDKFPSSIQVVLLTDYTLGQRFVDFTEKEKKFITKAGYKILVETKNDLR
jgi:hypothetical protein